ncbi:MAG: serine/threonine protein kinase [Polyangiaceae bacterium]|nr:serine/threonine protein kinase [Polyangiaceae bacterium]
MTLREGELIHSRYRLLRALGKGTSGSVWAARNELIEREVALKVMDPQVMSNRVLLQRFFNEAKAIGRVNHPSIVDILDLGQAEDGSPFLVLELLDGEPLDAKLRRDGVLDPETLFDVCAPVAQALGLAHQQGIVHRDLKPANIFLHRTATGQLVGKILDFGISKVQSASSTNFSLTKTGTVVGSPAYMSPEQAAGREDLDGRADVWSLGVVLHEALTGVLPHEAPNYNALMVRILTHDVAPIRQRRPDVPPVVGNIVDRCLQRSRDKRPTAQELSALMQDAVRVLRAERFKRTGGRRLGDHASRQRTADAALWRTVAVGALSGLVTGLIVVIVGYYLLR